jgi:hypothetical protein
VVELYCEVTIGYYTKTVCVLRQAGRHFACAGISRAGDGDAPKKCPTFVCIDIYYQTMLLLFCWQGLSRKHFFVSSHS